MPDPAVRDSGLPFHRRLHVYLRALLPGSDVDGALKETQLRIARTEPPAERLAEWADGIARQVAAERRKSTDPLPFSDDLFRQLADSAGPILDQSDRRPCELVEVLRQLPPPERDLLRRKYELGMTAEEIAVADGRAAAAVARDLAGLHESLVMALRAALPDVGPEPPGGAADIGRLSDQLLDGSIKDDGRLVLETLLLADAAAQAHYHRHAALTADLSWHYRGMPPVPEPPTPIPLSNITPRERLVTAAFVIAVLAVLVFVIVQLAR